MAFRFDSMHVEEGGSRQRTVRWRRPKDAAAQASGGGRRPRVWPNYWAKRLHRPVQGFRAGRARRE
jgi:hypothetical protein